MLTVKTQRQQNRYMTHFKTSELKNKDGVKERKASGITNRTLHLSKMSKLVKLLVFFCCAGLCRRTIRGRAENVMPKFGQ